MRKTHYILLFKKIHRSCSCPHTYQYGVISVRDQAEGVYQVEEDLKDQ